MELAQWATLAPLGTAAMQPTELPIPTVLPVQAATLASGATPTVRGILRSSFSEELSQVRISTILYDAAGQIVGGGAVTVAAGPPEEQATVTMSVVYTGTPTRIEIYAALSSRTLRG